MLQQTSSFRHSHNLMEPGGAGTRVTVASFPTARTTHENLPPCPEKHIIHNFLEAPYGMRGGVHAAVPSFHNFLALVMETGGVKIWEPVSITFRGPLWKQGGGSKSGNAIP